MDYKRFYGTFYSGETSEMLLLISKRLTKLISFKYNYLFKTANRVFTTIPQIVTTAIIGKILLVKMYKLIETLLN